jgi:tetratricopeptide (TPR) repeat protein
MTLVLGATVLAAAVLGAPPEGSDATPINLKDLADKEVSWAALSSHPLVLVFGELSHEGVKQTCGDVLDVLAEPRLIGTGAVPVLVIAQDAPLAQLREFAAQARFPAVILHDPKRDAFGAYRVLVVPTVVVVDTKGKVVHSMPGFIPRFKDVLGESILVASGKEPKERLEETIDPKAPVASPETIRADRLVHLGIELTRHGLYEMAEARFTEATKLSPGHIGATLGLGELMLRQDRLSDAEPLFRSVLASKPDSIEAALGVAGVQVKRGGDDLAKAEASLNGILQKDPKQAKARFLLGQVFERRGDASRAMVEYKRAAELALDR